MSEILNLCVSLPVAVLSRTVTRNNCFFSMCFGCISVAAVLLLRAELKSVQLQRLCEPQRSLCDSDHDEVAALLQASHQHIDHRLL